MSAALLMPIIWLCGCRQDSKLQVYETIQEAAAKGDIADVKRHIKRGADVNNKEYSIRQGTGLSALHLAAGAGNKDIVQLLIKNGAVVNAKAEDNMTPLHWAAAKTLKGGSLGDYPGVIEELADTGADINALTDQNRWDGGSPLHVAMYQDPSDMEIIRTLIDQGADVNLRDAYGRGPLAAVLFRFSHTADMSVAEFLLKQGADVNAEDLRGQTPLERLMEMKDMVKDFEGKVELLKKYGAREK